MTKTKTTKKILVVRKKKTPKVQKKQVRMGPVTTVTTAPVAIGNSIRGASSQSQFIPNGVLVAGRDFMFTPIGSGSITTWCMVGGTPLTPAAFADSTLRNYMQMYQKYRWRKCVAHYITSSPTSANGDVMFYRAKNRDSVFLSQTSSQLLQLVISDPDTVIGPQWTNHSMQATVNSEWKSTDYGMGDALNDYADGELFLLSKTSTTDSPGYVLFDYLIEFAEMQITPRLLSLPIPRIQYSQCNIGLTAVAVTGSLQVYGTNKGNNLSGTTSVIPTGCTQGDIYKVIIDLTNSTAGSWTNVAATSLIQVHNSTANANSSFTVVDGTTLYAVYAADSNFYFFANVIGAYAGTGQLTFNVTATITYNLQCFLSLVGTLNSTNLNPNF